jgi:thiol:disulfide interchange protein DsbD
VKRRFFWFLFFLLLPDGSSSLLAESVKAAHTEVELIAQTRSLQPGTKIYAAVRFKMDPGWHIYWKNPGDSGLAPKIEWQLPDGLTAGPLQWPFPRKIEQKPLVSYGYEGEVLLMVPIQVPESLPAGKTLNLKVVVSWLACQVDCIPGKAELELSLPVERQAPQAEERWAKAFSETKGRLPLIKADWKIQAVSSGKKIIMEIEPAPGMESALSGLYFFAENPGLVRHAAPQNFRKTSAGYALEIPLSRTRPQFLERLQGVLVSGEGWRGRNSEKALEVDTALNRNFSKPEIGFLTAIFFAFLGGLILNLMPCVLPVLSLKILSLVKEAAENPRTLFQHGLVFTGGVLASFWLLAGLLILLQAAGRHVGWGFQLQSPAFLIALAFLFFLFGLNLFGVFEIGTSLTGIGESWRKRRGFAGSFSSGVLATVVATPCTAPFMGSALGYALSQPPWVSISIFISLGLGLSAPYLILCAHPAFLRFLPKPGAWMIALKRFLGFLLMATTAWLAWVLSLQAGQKSVLWLLGGLLTAGFGVWLPGRRKVVAVCFIAAGLLISFPGTYPEPAGAKKSFAPASRDQIAWEPYSEERLLELQNQGRAVFINFTAAWCLTCQINERVALRSPRVAEAFRRADIAALKADWTSQDDKIARALGSYGRNSIPLYVLHRKKGKPPIILPELLTPAIVLEALASLEKEI